MNCEQTKIELTAYADGNLSDSQRTEVQAHLEVCPACKTEMERFERLFASCRTLPQVEPSTTFTSKVMQRVTQKKVAYRRLAQSEATFWERVRAFVWRPSFGVSALAHAAILLVLAFVVAQATGVFNSTTEIASNTFTLISSHNITDADRHYPHRSGTCVLNANVIMISEYLEDGPVYLQQDKALRFVDVLPSARFADEEGLALVAGLPRADIRDGKLSLPEEMRSRVFGKEKTIVALLLDDRLELWAGSKYEAFKKMNTSNNGGFQPLAFIILP